MKSAPWFLLLLLLGLTARPAQAFLASGDPDNFFLLLENAPVVAVVKVGSTEAPAPNRPFYLQELKKSSLLRGEFSGDRFKVAEEVLVPGQKSLFTEKEESLALLAPIPDFTAYRDFLSRGYVWRVFGGKRGVWPAAAILSIAQSYLTASAAERNSILLKILPDAANPLRREAILLLARRGPVPITSEEAASLAALAQGSAEVDLALAAVRVLDDANNEAARQALIKLADGPSSSAKWAAIRALEKKGQSRSVAQLAEDYQSADAAGRAQALSLIAARQDDEALAFFANLIAGSSGFEAKREAIQKMGERKSPGYERLLIKQIGGADESIQAEAIVALGKMGSTEAVPSILPLIDSPSEKLRGAAFFMLIESPDPRAQALISQRYERDHHGGWEKNPHFYGNPQPVR